MNAPKKKLKMPGDRESAEINRAIASDPDTWVASETEWRRMRPAVEVDPDLAGTRRGAQSSSSQAQKNDSGFHVVPADSEGWLIQRAGRIAVSERYARKADAIARARQLASQSGAELVEHRRDGTISGITRPIERKDTRSQNSVIRRPR